MTMANELWSGITLESAGFIGIMIKTQDAMSTRTLLLLSYSYILAYSYGAYKQFGPLNSVPLLVVLRSGLAQRLL